MAQQSTNGSGQQYSRLYPPYEQPQSPDTILPPAKRQRMSPETISPYVQTPQQLYAGAPTFANVNLPSVFNGSRQNGNPALQLNGSMQYGSQPVPGLMGPPQRPSVKIEDKQDKTKKEFDINDLSDVVTSSGIDFREEENYLAASYRSERRDVVPSSQRSMGPSPNQSFDLLARNSFGSIGTSHGSGLFDESSSIRTLEEEVNEAHKIAARELNELRQYHLEDPFLLGAPVRQRMQKIANDFEVKLPMDGLFDKVQGRPTMSGQSATNADGSAGVVSVTAPSLLNRSAPLDGILTLLSLATNERVRTLLEEAYGLARSRQSGSDGLVPPLWSDLAIGSRASQTTAVPVSVSGTAWDATQSTQIDNKAQTTQETDPSTAPTVSFSKKNSVTEHLVAAAKAARAAEEARLKKRAERQAKRTAAQAAQLTTEVANGVITAEASGTPTPLGENSRQPSFAQGEVAPETKVSKKERDKLAKQDQNDEAATRNTNLTATMQLGGRKYNWMSGGSKSANRPAVHTPKPSGGDTPGTGTPRPLNGQTEGPRERKFGEWREDGVGGKDVQMRDWITALERDGREKKALQLAYIDIDLGESRIDGTTRRTNHDST